MVALGLLSALLYGLADFGGGYSSRKTPILAVLVVSQAAGATLALAFCLADSRLAPSGDITRGLAAGISGLLGIATLYAGIARGSVSIVSPLSAVVGAALPFAYGLLIGETPSATAVAGAALCFPSIILLGLGEKGEAGVKGRLTSVLFGLVAGLGFGGFFVIISGADPGSGLWPLFAARVASVSLLVIATVFWFARGGKGFAIPLSVLPVIAAVGLADMGANILFVLATRAGFLSTVSVITSLYPAPTVLMAWAVLKERLPPSRIAGLVLALGGIALISAG
jgi:drug/metabolite transporter (DMT)-like permease